MSSSSSTVTVFVERGPVRYPLDPMIVALIVASSPAVVFSSVSTLTVASVLHAGMEVFIVRTVCEPITPERLALSCIETLSAVLCAVSRRTVNQAG